MPADGIKDAQREPLASAAFALKIMLLRPELSMALNASALTKFKNSWTRERKYRRIKDLTRLRTLRSVCALTAPC